MGAEMNKVNRPRDYMEVAEEINVVISEIRNLEIHLEEARSKVNELELRRAGLASKLAWVWREAEDSALFVGNDAATNELILQELRRLRRPGDRRSDSCSITIGG